uniref:Uncharacterized protein n=1 Tax=Anopheles quadriannulatus TaxID=34691 RepID=A0A182XS73_ANOQN
MLHLAAARDAFAMAITITLAIRWQPLLQHTHAHTLTPALFSGTLCTTISPGLRAFSPASNAHRLPLAQLTHSARSTAPIAPLTETTHCIRVSNRIHKFYELHVNIHNRTSTTLSHTHTIRC